MPDDIRTIAIDALKALQQSQAKVEQLTAQLNKKASITPDAALVEQTVTALTKVGALTQQEGVQARQLFLTDPNATLRCITGLLSARSISKTASQANDPLQFGNLVSSQRISTPAPKQGRTRVIEILRQST